MKGRDTVSDEDRTLLLGTGIASRVRELIRGRIARAGGTVDQLVSYRNCRVDDINIPDGGFGKVWRGGLGAVRSIYPRLKRTVRQELLFLLYGQRISLDRKTIILDMHDAHAHPELHGRYDCAISSNLLEHSPNPIWLLLNFYLITRRNGYQFHAIPNYRYTYDRFREPTPVKHFIEDFEKGTDSTDASHVEDYRQSAVVKDGWQKQFHEKYPLQYPFIHFHVFDENNTRELFEFMFQDVTNDLLKSDRFADNVVLFKNALNPGFVDRYKSIINGYSPLLLGMTI